jgi:hypothetical protein
MFQPMQKAPGCRFALRFVPTLKVNPSKPVFKSGPKKGKEDDDGKGDML